MLTQHWGLTSLIDMKNTDSFKYENFMQGNPMYFDASSIYIYFKSHLNIFKRWFFYSVQLKYVMIMILAYSPILYECVLHCVEWVRRWCRSTGIQQ